jgi:hypothetical protein
MDEYFYPGPEGPNKENASSGTQNGWDEWIGSNNIGYRPHFHPVNCENPTYNNQVADWWKPTSGVTGSYDGICKMEQITEPFCSVCKEAIIYKIWDEVNAVDPDENLNPLQNTSVTPFETSSALTFEITNMIEPMPSHMEVRWFFNGTEVSGSVDYANGAAPGTTEYKWTFDCSLLDGLTIGDVYMVQAKVLDRSGSSGNEFIRKASHATDHTETYTWYVKNTGENTDLWMRDHIDDVGEEPWSPFGWFFDESPDIKVSQTDQGDPAGPTFDFGAIQHQNPIVQSTNYVYVQVHNRGCETSTAGEDLAVYTSIAGSWNS